MRRLVVGDIHGYYDKLRNALDKASFDPDKDTLYSLGDLCDRGPEPVKVLNYMYSLPNLKIVLGNHDLFMLEYLETGFEDPHWIVRNDGLVTLDGMRSQSPQWRRALHNRLLNTPFALKDRGILLCHGGFSDPFKKGRMSSFVDKTVSGVGFGTEEYKSLKMGICWNRSYYGFSLTDGQCNPYTKNPDLVEDNRPHRWHRTLFVGHTIVKTEPPVPFENKRFKIVNVDTGSYRENGLITVMDMDSRKYYQA